MLRRTRYQYYTNVNYRTCEKCLGLHGLIRRDPDGFPDHRDGCERAVLPIPGREMKEYREKGRRMRAAAKAELTRRKLFEEGERLLAVDAAAAVDRFAAAAKIDVYVPDLEAFVERQRETLAGDLQLRHDLRTLFVKAYSDKFGWRRYERLPEVMRLERENAGKARINELFE